MQSAQGRRWLHDARKVVGRIRRVVPAPQPRRPHDRVAMARLGRVAQTGALMTAADKELLAAWRAVANAKLAEFRRQCWRLALLTRQGMVDKTAAVDRLTEIATAHALVRALGEDRIEAILAEAFADADFHPMRAEVA